MTRVLGLTLVSALLLGATATPAPGAGPPVDVVDARDADHPAGCKVRAVAETVRDLFAHAGRDAGAAVRFLAPDDAFRWYSVGDNRPGELTVPANRNTTLTTRAQVRRHFAARMRKRERLQLRAISVAVADDGSRASIVLTGRRRASDLRDRGIRTTRISAKGAIDCASGGVMVVSMSMRYGGDGRVCRKDPVKRRIIACSER
jgi:hypothetical protein